MNTPEYKYFIDEQEEKQSNKLFYKFAIILFAIYIILFGSVFVFRSNFEYVTINGESMQSTLNPNPQRRENADGEINDVQDGVYIKKTTKVDYGDIIVINQGEDDSIIKRVLAFGGDYVTIASVEYDGTRDYRLMRVKSGSENVEILYEDYIKSYDSWNMVQGTIVDNVEYENPLYSVYTYLGYETKELSVFLDGEERDVVFFKIPENHVFYMGDNRTGSRDARSTGTSPQKYIEGYVVKIVRNGTFIKDDAVSWFFQQIKDYFDIIWKEILIFFGANA